MPLNPLNSHYAMENPASVYDEEAMTALELAGRTTAKVNETVRAFNELEVQTNEHLETQDQTIKNRLDEQDNKITTMNDVTMPAKVKAETQRHINSGEFDAQIEAHAGNLSTRVDSLLGKVVQGSTTMDAEIIDGRTGADGTVYENIGQAVREQHKEAMAQAYSPIELARTDFHKANGNLCNYKDPNFVLNGYYDETGTYTEYSGIHQTGFIPVIGGHNYIANDRSGFVVWYDAGRIPLSKSHSKVWFEVGYMTAPTNACYARFITTLPTNNFIVAEGETLPTYLNEYRCVIPRESMELIIEPGDTTFMEPGGKNLVNKNDRFVLHDIYCKATGDYGVSEGMRQTGFIRVVPGASYVSSQLGTFILWYDHMRNVIAETISDDNNGPVVAPEGAHWGRWIFVGDDAWDMAQVEVGTVQSPYEEYVPGNLSKERALDIRFTSYGDSITYRNTWQPHLVHHFGMAHTNLGIGSTSMAYVESVESQYPSMVNETRIQAIKDSNPDVITILGGANDAAYNVPVGAEDELKKGIDAKNKTTYYGALSYLLSTLLTWKPTLEIILMTPMNTATTGYAEVYDSYANAVRKTGDYYGVTVIDTAKVWGKSLHHVNTYTDDGVHPNALGSLKIANAVGAKIADIYRMR